MLVRIGDGIVDGAEEVPLLGRVTGLFEQFALGTGQCALVRVELAGRQFDEDAVVGITVLPFEQNGAVVEQRQDDCRTGVANVFAHRGLAVGQPHSVALHLQKRTVVGELPLDLAFFQVLVHGNQTCGRADRIASTQASISGPGRIPRASAPMPLIDSSTRVSIPASIGDLSVASSKYMTLSTRK